MTENKNNVHNTPNMEKNVKILENILPVVSPIRQSNKIYCTYVDIQKFNTK